MNPLKKKTKTTLFIIAVFFFVPFSFWFGSQLYKTETMIEVSTESDLNTIKDTDGNAIFFEQKASDIAVVNDIAVIADNDGFSVLYEKTGTETQITTYPASSVVFDGKTAYFVQKQLIDQSVTVLSEEDESRDEDWERGRVFVYDLVSNQVQPLFDSNGFNTFVIYADHEYIYYTDYADERVGWFTGESQHFASTLYRYDLKTGNRETISDYASKIGTIGNRLIYTDARGASYRHKTWFNGGGLHIYDTISSKDYYIDDESEFLYAEEGALVYVTAFGYDGYGSPCECRIMRCDLDGENKTEVQQISGSLEHHFSQYLVFEKENYTEESDRYLVYNAVTDKAMASPNYYYDTYNGNLISLPYDEPGRIYVVTDTGEEKLFLDVTSQLPDKYAATIHFNDNGIYCVSREGTNYKFISFSTGVVEADPVTESSVEEETSHQPLTAEAESFPATPEDTRAYTEDTDTTQSTQRESGTEKRESSTYAEWGDWSQWQTDAVGKSGTREVETKEQYSFRDKQTTTSSEPSLSGWTQSDAAVSYGPWDAWSSWTTTSQTHSETKDVETRKVYYYYHYCDGNGNFAQSTQYAYGKYGPHTLYSTTELKIDRISAAGNLEIVDGETKCEKACGSYYYGGTVTQYRYRTRTQSATYSFWKWDDWTAFSDEVAQASDNRQVRTRTVYRYRDLVTVS